MGCDGGTIPRRDELVRTKKKPEQKDKDSELIYRWRHCAITQLPLEPPIVACGLGRLYRKDSLIEAMLDKANPNPAIEHIKSLKDVKLLNLTRNPAFTPSIDKGDSYIDRQLSPYICPIIGLEMNGKFKFIFLWNCGCVFSERGIKILKTEVCHQCQKHYSNDDIVVLNGSEEEVKLAKEKMEARKKQQKSEKKVRNQEKIKTNDMETVTSAPETGDACEPTTSASTSSSSSFKIPERKVNGTAMKRESNGTIPDPDFKKTKTSYSVAKDPKATEVFKSLFTSHRTAAEQTKAHWITYNPFYN